MVKLCMEIGIELVCTHKRTQVTLKEMILLHFFNSQIARIRIEPLMLDFTAQYVRSQENLAVLYFRARLLDGRLEER